MFELEALNAKHGDALLLHWTDAQKPKLAIIDGGPPGVWKSTLKPRLDALRKAREVDALVVNLLMVSHIDDDHIAGVIDLLSFLKKLRDDQEKLPLDVVSIWHNSWPDALRAASMTPSTLPADVTPAALDAGLLPPDLRGALTEQTQAVLASVPQGKRVRDLANGLSIAVNPGFNPLVIAPASGAREVKLGTLTLTVIGPSAGRVAELKAEWQAKVGGRKPKPAELADYVEKTASNLSSIVVLAQHGKKRMLLTGDARGDDVLAGLERAKLLPQDGTLHVDVLKVAHHGSFRNHEQDFFDRVLAKHYVFSADGSNDNPDVETLELLTKARGNDRYGIWLTNDVKHATDFFKEDRRNNKGRRYEVILPKKGALSITVRP